VLTYTCKKNIFLLAWEYKSLLLITQYVTKELFLFALIVIQSQKADSCTKRNLLKNYRGKYGSHKGPALWTGCLFKTLVSILMRHRSE
jgi:hypothetical protein